MPRDSRQKWTEFRLRAAHAHLAPTRRGKQDYQVGHEQSRQALEHAARAFLRIAGSSSKICKPRSRTELSVTRESCSA